MQKVKHLFCENRGRKLAVLLLGAFGYALLTALCSQIEQVRARRHGAGTLARFAAAFPIAFVVLAALLAIANAETDVQAARKPKTLLHMGRGAAVFRVLYADAAHRISRFVHL